MNVIFRSKNLERFNSLWNEFAANTVTSHRYLLEYKEYQKSYLGQEVKDHSFVIEENNRPVGIAPLILTKHNLEKTQVFLPAPFATSEKSRDQALIQIDEILKNESVGSYGLFIDCFTEPTCSWNYLKKFGYVECNEDVVFLDLKKSKEELWSQLRKSYKAIINSNLKNPDISFHFFEGETADFSSHEEYRELHHKCSGRITRSIESFKKQFELVTQGNGLFSGMKYKGNWVSFTYFLYKNDKAVYFSASDDPDVKDTSNVYHALLWQSFLYLSSHSSFC